MMSSKRHAHCFKPSLGRSVGFAGVRRPARILSLLLGLLAAWATSAAAPRGYAAGQWPTYRHDIARSGITDDPIAPPLVECWVFQPRQPPSPAWGDPKAAPVEGYQELRRIHFDDVFQPVTDGEAVYFGSSADNKVYCLDGATGRIRWTRITGGPIRLAPTVVDGRVYFGSDDGYAYCLDAGDGSIQWKFRAAPENERVLGHGKMISLWPLRTGVLVDRGVAYFGAGIFPAEGVFLYALDAQSGKQLWCNDTCGEAPQSRISPQGYLLASKTSLYAPMNRVSPAAFDRQDGQLKYTTFFGKAFGGTYALLADEQIYTGTEEIIAYQQDTRDRFAVFDGRKLVVAPETAYVATETELSALDRKTFPAASRRLYALATQQADLDKSLKKARAQKDKSAAAQKEYAQLVERAAKLKTDLDKARAQFDACIRWRIPCPCHESLILAGDVLLAGGAGEVMAVAADSGKVLWKDKVDGAAKGLAAAGGRLLASTDQGEIYCFGPQGSPQHGTISETGVSQQDPFGDSHLGPLFQQTAETILRETGVRRGYCLVLGCETGQLALELAKRSELMIYAVDSDAEKVEAARRAIDSTGLYGARVCVDEWPKGKIPYSDYAFNLIVSESAMVGGDLPSAAEVARLLKPCGGVLFIGQPEIKFKGLLNPLKPQAVRSWLEQIGLGQQAVVTGVGRTWTKLVRGPLPGAGNWTHQYANPGNTACGDDELVHCPMGVLWFGNPGPGKMVNRHQRAAAPLAFDGRLFIQGENLIMAYDIYNGLPLWRREIPGAMRANASHDGSNLAVSSRGLFVAVRDQCLRLDPATGKTERTYGVPPADDGGTGRWGYLSTSGETLFGTRGKAPVASECLFAIDVQSGKTRWKHDGKRIPHNSIAIGDGKVFLIDSGTSQVVALDARTGKVRWKQSVDLKDCGGANPAAIYSEGVLAIFGVYLDGHYWQQFFAGEFDSRRVTAISGDDGKVLWSKAIGYRVRPLVIGDTLHAEPWAYDLKTGEPRTRVHPVTGEVGPWQFSRTGHHCGCPSASPGCLFFRSYCLGFYDLVSDSGTTHFGAQRPGCWINFIPAGGLLLMPEASAGCMCPFPNMCTVVFRPAAESKGFTEYSAVGDMTPVRRLAINLGAAGDHADAAGNLWLGYPRPFQGRLVLDFKIDTNFYPGGKFIERNSTYTPIAGTDDPWLFASAARGLRKCAIPLRGKADGTALYSVRLAFADPDNSEPGRRVFDVKLQGRTVLKGLDIAAAAGGRDRALVKQFSHVAVDDRLLVELVAKSSRPSPEAAPIVDGVEAVLEKVVSLGCAVPDFLLSNQSPKQAGTIEVANFHEGKFEGTIRAAAPEGFTVTLGQSRIELASGSRMSIPLEVAVAKEVPAGEYPLSVSLVRGDGTVEMERSAVLEHLGPRVRMVFPAVEDVSVVRRYLDQNKGSVGVLLVDGGDQKMGDESHAVAYIKFALSVPGKVASVRFRIHNAGNPSGDAGRVCLAVGPWSESKLTYSARAEVGRELARLGRVSENQTVECPLDLDLEGKTELSLVIDPTSCDGIDYLSRESSKPPELIIEYEPNP